MPAQLHGLAKRHPDRDGKASGHRRGPKHQDMDTGICRAVVTKGPGNLSGGWFSVPRFGPWPDALLKVGNNALGDAGVNVLAGCFSHVGVLFGGAPGWNRTSDPRLRSGRTEVLKRS